MKITIPENPSEIINRLENRGFEAFAVGGCVRDAMLGIAPHDWDICTNALPGQIKQCFAQFKTIDTGIRHGTVGIVLDNTPYEVTTYRVDGHYSDNRRPDRVSFTSDITRDLSRRDFTVNAIAFSEKRGLIDPFDGIRDLKNGVIRCVGNPNERFNEDALRILRALRFASRLGFVIEANTADELKQNALLLKNIAAERIQAEFTQILTGKYAEEILNEYREVIAVFIPEITPCFDFDQHTVHHKYDVYRHITRSVAGVNNEPVLRISMFFHDIAKPLAMTEDSDGTRHFKGHQKLSADIANDVLRRLKYPNALVDSCVKLILYHDVRFNGTKKQVKRLMNKVGKDLMPMLFKVMKADYNSQSDFMREEKLSSVTNAEKQYEQILLDNECFSLKELKIKGNDLISTGICEGKTIGIILNALLDEVIEEKTKNKKADLLNRAKQLLNETKRADL
ncbi:MAG TPA: polynucleotide adenylyltransferase [Ruminococcaceae bacterium]|nr:polynucleotide adenylyltransferase [Oscillospiraceae bacterium]